MLFNTPEFEERNELDVSGESGDYGGSITESSLDS